MQNQYLEDLLYEVGLISKKVQADFGRFNAQQLNWKPAPNKWSIAQCLDHLIKSNEQYFPMLEQVAKGTHKTTFMERLPGLPKLFANMMLKALDPSNQKKLRSPASFTPSASQLPASIVADFVRHQQELVRLVQATNRVDHVRTIVSSPVSGLMTFSLQDAVRILVVHEERHFMQAKRVLRVKGFPHASGQAV
ncbi:MAG: DinB family protein [Adhaeribacter sp.]